MIFRSVDPASQDILWEGEAADAADCAAAVEQARAAFPGWAALSPDDRQAFVMRYKALLSERADVLSTVIARETGKPHWEAKAEVASMIGKIDLSIAAQAERAGSRVHDMAFGRAMLRHKPHGVMVVLGPYNFPGHLPNGHIVPALLAGDCVIFKPSELTPLVGEMMAKALHDAGIPAGVFTLLQGGRDSGASLIAQDIDGLLFTGSSSAGAHFARIMADRPQVILALELGGNNPLVAWDGDPQAAASIIVQSAFITAGQRCSCARRLIVPQGRVGDAIIDATVALTRRLTIGLWDAEPEPFMGSLISGQAARHARERHATLVASGAVEWTPFLQPSGFGDSFLSPAIIDVTGLDVPDEEIFAPLLQVRRVSDFGAAIAAANATRFGLAAGLISDDDTLWDRFFRESRAGVVNRNRPTTGASGALPFGGLGASGNHRPSAHYAADYCAYPVASFEAPKVLNQIGDIRGLVAP